MPEATTLGGRFATALTEKDFARAGELFHPEVDFRALTPSRFWEASSPDEVVADILPKWLEPSDEVESLDATVRGAGGFGSRPSTPRTVASSRS